MEPECPILLDLLGQSEFQDVRQIRESIHEEVTRNADEYLELYPGYLEGDELADKILLYFEYNCVSGATAKVMFKVIAKVLSLNIQIKLYQKNDISKTFEFGSIAGNNEIMCYALLQCGEGFHDLTVIGPSDLHILHQNFPQWETDSRRTYMVPHFFSSPHFKGLTEGPEGEIVEKRKDGLAGQIKGDKCEYEVFEKLRQLQIAPLLIIHNFKVDTAITHLKDNALKERLEKRLKKKIDVTDKPKTNKIDGECDFIMFHKQLGVFVVEVKSQKKIKGSRKGIKEQIGRFFRICTAVLEDILQGPHTGVDRIPIYAVALFPNANSPEKEDINDIEELTSDITQVKFVHSNGFENLSSTLEDIIFNRNRVQFLTDRKKELLSLVAARFVTMKQYTAIFLNDQINDIFQNKLFRKDILKKSSKLVVKRDIGLFEYCTIEQEAVLKLGKAFISSICGSGRNRLVTEKVRDIVANPSREIHIVYVICHAETIKKFYHDLRNFAHESVDVRIMSVIDFVKNSNIMWVILHNKKFALFIVHGETVNLQYFNNLKYLYDKAHIGWFFYDRLQANGDLLHKIENDRATNNDCKLLVNFANVGHIREYLKKLKHDGNFKIFGLAIPGPHVITQYANMNNTEDYMSKINAVLHKFSSVITTRSSENPFHGDILIFLRNAQRAELLLLEKHLHMIPTGNVAYNYRGLRIATNEDKIRSYRFKLVILVFFGKSNTDFQSVYLPASRAVCQLVIIKDETLWLNQEINDELHPYPFREKVKRPNVSVSRKSRKAKRGKKKKTSAQKNE